MDTLSQFDCDNLKVEIALHSGLQHPHIIRFVDSLQVDNIVYLLLEYAQNNALFFYISAETGLPEHLALRFFYQTALGVKYLHDKLIIHRDLKPENILLNENFDVKICDFGWSSQLLDEQDFKASVCGTFEYMSPEILDESLHCRKTDIWCLGIFLFEMLTGNPPFKGNSLEEMRHNYKTKGVVLSTKYSKEVRNLIKGMLKRKENDRMTIDEVLEHEAFADLKPQFAQPLCAQDIAQLKRNYQENAQHHNIELRPLAELEAAGAFNGGPRNLLNAACTFVQKETAESFAVETLQHYKVSHAYESF